MIKKSGLIAKISDQLAFLQTAVLGRGQLGLFEIHKAAEDFFCGLLNLAYGYDLSNLNSERPDYPAIDLGDSGLSIGFQITAQNKKRKIQDTLKLAVEHGVYKAYPKLYVFIVGQKAGTYRLIVPAQISFDPKTQILDLNDYRKRIAKVDSDTLKRIEAYLSSEMVGFGGPRGGGGGNANAKEGGAAIGGRGGHAGDLGDGGKGGDAVADGKVSLAIGGRGGRGGIGPGPKGGDTMGSVGNVIIGGDGGSADRSDGRGGRGGRACSELIGISPMRMPDGRFFGEGGSNPNTSTYDGKVATVRGLLREYYNLDSMPRQFIPDISAAVPLLWLNARLAKIKASWRVEIDARGEFEFKNSSDSTYGDHAWNGTALLESSTASFTLIPPKGIALLISERSEWKIPVEKGSVSRNILGTIDAQSFDSFPHTCGPLSAYVRISGSGHVALSLRLDAPNGEVIVARDAKADNWGNIGAWEWSVHVDQFQLPLPGIYFWRLLHGDNVLLEYPMIVRQADSKAAESTGEKESTGQPKTPSKEG